MGIILLSAVVLTTFAWTSTAQNPCDTRRCSFFQSCHTVSSPDGRLEARCLSFAQLPRASGSCNEGTPLLVQSGRGYALETCGTGNDCRQGFVCTQASRGNDFCCRASTQTASREGRFCPAPFPATPNEACVTRCLSDGDCPSNRKCCQTSDVCVKTMCENTVTFPSFPRRPQTGIQVQPSVVREQRTACNSQADCSAGEVCRMVEDCSATGTCIARGNCMAQAVGNQLRFGCINSLPLLTPVGNGQFLDRTCHSSNACPSGAYCNTEVMDRAAFCCMAAAPEPKLGTCPSTSQPGCGMDKCVSDSDCPGERKCCQNSATCAQMVCKSIISSNSGLQISDPCASCPADTTCSFEGGRAQCRSVQTARLQNTSAPVTSAQCPASASRLPCFGCRGCSSSNPSSCSSGTLCCRTAFTGMRCVNAPTVQPQIQTGIQPQIQTGIQPQIQPLIRPEIQPARPAPAARPSRRRFFNFF